jgi:predicted tellurium resistance membrane protein TerC
MEPTLLENLTTLVMLVMLQAVLGFDNLLYISLESKNAPEDKQSYVRRVGILIAIALRIALLFILINLIKLFQDPVIFIPASWSEFISGTFNIHSLIVLLGGAFILYTALKEIWHMIALEEGEVAHENKSKSITQVILMIILMNLVFSFDSILGAMALTDVFWVWLQPLSLVVC